MNETKCKSEAYIYGLLNNLLSDEDVIAWADSLILESDFPEEWLLDLCGCKKGERKKIIGILNQVAGETNFDRINEEILSLYNKKTNSFSLFGREELADDFSYPSDLENMAKNGCYIYNPQIEWLDRKWDHMKSLLRQIQEVNISFVPFAKIDDRFLCLDKNHVVYIVDIVEKKQVKIGSYNQWFAEYVSDSKRGCWYQKA